MWSYLSKALDQIVIRQASAGVPYGQAQDNISEASELLHGPDFFCSFAESAPELQFSDHRRFHFASAVSTPWSENNTVFGQLYRSEHDWRTKPSVILLHGWNGELGYRFQFPYLAWRLSRSGVNVALIELPYHGQRKPTTPGALQNFISHDLLRMLEATRQAIADTRALVGWLVAQGSLSVGLLGFSLGGWLAGLVACHDARIKFATLTTPVVKLERAIAELPFCSPIRESLKEKTLSLEQLCLASLSPLTAPGNILLVACQHDLFAPVETIEELWQAWRDAEILRAPHGHISVLMSMSIMGRIIRWIVKKATVESATRLVEGVRKCGSEAVWE